MPLIEHVMTKNVMQGDQRKSDATVEMERPTDVSAVQGLLELVKNHHAAWHTRMRVDLDSIAENAFEDIKETLSKAPLLKYFSESDLPKNLGDASKDALGFV